MGVKNAFAVDNGPIGDDVVSSQFGRILDAGIENKVTGQKGPCLTFEYQIFNALFKTVSDCENFYNTASYEGVLQFGEEFSALESGKNATLYEFK